MQRTNRSIQSVGELHRELKPVSFADHWADWILEKMDPVSMWTLTFRGDPHPEQALKNFKWLVRILNVEKYGKRYRNKFKHSYFGYVVVVEKHKNGEAHLHVLVDRKVDYRRVHELWKERFGILHIKTIHNPVSAAKYVSKYCVKRGSPDCWFPDDKK